jgi:hypothetical protein
MDSELRPGPASMAGLVWLARVGAVPIDAWRCAMGWAKSTAISHARRLEGEGWAARYAMTRGSGHLVVATRRGVQVSGLGVSAPSPPSAPWWAHDCACAWTAAWLSVRGRDWHGPREVLGDADLAGEIEWRTGSGLRRAGHRPDLAVVIPDGTVAIEAELERKSNNRLGAILSLYSRWIREERLAGVMYVCADQRLAERVSAYGSEVGIREGALRTLLVEQVRQEALGARR